MASGYSSQRREAPPVFGKRKRAVSLRGSGRTYPLRSADTSPGPSLSPPRPFPPLLNPLDVAWLLGALFIEALNTPEPIDTKRLQALPRLAALLLKAIGVTNASSPVHQDPREPPPAGDCLLRTYPPFPH